MRLVLLFMFLNSLVLTFAPAVRLHTWQAEMRWQHWIGFFTWLTGYVILYRQMNKSLPERDPYLLPIIALLNGWGLLMIYRLSTSFGIRQTMWTALSIIGILAALKYKNLLPTLRRYKYVWLISGLLLTLLTFVIGTYPGGDGPGLWLNLGSVYIQPSEILKLLLIVYLSAYLADTLQARLRLAQLLTPTLILIAAAVLILIAQRDLGTATLFIILYTIVVYLASGKRRVLLISFIIVTLSLIAGFLIFDVIQLRVEAWLNPWHDARDRSYQIIQSLIAVANGGILGRGLGLGSPGVIPVAHSDFIFPAILEEFGIAGGIALVMILALFTVRGLTIALRAPNQFQRFLAAGLTAFIATQSILIMGGTVRLLPLTGVTLPFISYGGTSLVVSMASALLLMIISNQPKDQAAPVENTRPYMLVGGLILFGFATIAMLGTYWGFIRAESLLARGDNPRRAISDMYVYRGSIFDRNNHPLTANTGAAGAYTRQSLYPPLSAVIGYSDPNYGQTGIEFRMDDYLRGIATNSSFHVHSLRLLYGQDPEGFDLRLSLDLPLQQISDQALAPYTGAVVLLNAASGEIVVMSTSPTFNANELEANWQTWMEDENAPLLNRATQALYPPGGVTAGILLARFLSEYTPSSAVPDYPWTTKIADEYFCAIQPATNPSWGELLSSGCVKALSTFSRSSLLTDTLGLFKDAGLYQELDLPLEASIPVLPESVAGYSDLYSGSAGILVSPVQVAVAVATLSNGGRVITPQIVTAYSQDQTEWSLFEQGVEPLTLSDFEPELAATMLTSGDFPGWEVTACATYENASISWYAAGTPSDWFGTPLTIVVALENTDALIAREIGREVLLAATASLSE